MWKNELKKNFDWMQRGDYSLLETLIEQLLKEQKKIDKTITHKIALAAYERDFTSWEEVERMYSLAKEPETKCVK